MSNPSRRRRARTGRVRDPAPNIRRITVRRERRLGREHRRRALRASPSRAIASVTHRSPARDRRPSGIARRPHPPIHPPTTSKKFPSTRSTARITPPRRPHARASHRSPRPRSPRIHRARASSRSHAPRTGSSPHDASSRRRTRRIARREIVASSSPEPGRRRARGRTRRRTWRSSAGMARSRGNLPIRAIARRGAIAPGTRRDGRFGRGVRTTRGGGGEQIGRAARIQRLDRAND